MTVITGAATEEQCGILRSRLVTGYRILDHEQIVDGSGHLSVRIPGTSQFIIHPRMAPGQATVETLLVLGENGEVLQGTGTKPLEWPIHARIYAARPDVNSVMHAHSRMSRIFSVSPVPLRPLNALSFNFFEPSGVPVYRGCGLITTAEDGEAVASVLAGNTAVLLRGHGSVVVGQSIQHTVVLSIMLEQMAETLHAVLSHGEPEYFTDDEVAQWRERTAPGVQKAWDYYCYRAGIETGGPLC